MGKLADEAFSLASLSEAWQSVQSRSDDPVPSIAIQRFAEDAVERLERTSEELGSGEWRPHDLFEVRLNERQKERVLHIPSVRDRVVERAILDTITPIVDPLLGAASYGYRPGLGVSDAVQAVVGLRDEGLRWVLRTDVDDCFPSLPVALALRRLEAALDDEALLDVVRLLFARRSKTAKGRSYTPSGAPQGSALSPLVANLCLVDLDDALLQEGFAVVRYADDLVVATESSQEAWEAARVASAAMEELGMSLGNDKTEVMSFDEGFAFLGDEFGPRYPPATDAASVDVPDRKVLYAAPQGGRIRVARGRVLVESADDRELLNLPQSAVSRMVLFGSVGLSAGAREWAMNTEREVVLCSRRGSYQGQLVGRDQVPPLDRLQAQIAFASSPAAIGLSRAIVEAKVRKQIVVLQRFGRRAHREVIQDAVHQMRQAMLLLPDCAESAEVMGIEGAAAAAYFPALGRLVPDEVAFELRSRQPPRDLVNAALSFGYTVLLGECESAIMAAGLDTRVGILHRAQGRRPSLALDILEEFRPLVVDQCVLNLTRGRSLTLKHERREEGKPGVLMNRAGRETFIRAYEARMLSTTRGALPDFAGSLRRHLYRQAQRLRATIESPGISWSGLAWR